MTSSSTNTIVSEQQNQLLSIPSLYKSYALMILDFIECLMIAYQGANEAFKKILVVCHQYCLPYYLNEPKGEDAILPDDHPFKIVAEFVSPLKKEILNEPYSIQLRSQLYRLIIKQKVCQKILHHHFTAMRRYHDGPMSETEILHNTLDNATFTNLWNNMSNEGAKNVFRHLKVVCTLYQMQTGLPDFIIKPMQTLLSGGGLNNFFSPQRIKDIKQGKMNLSDVIGDVLMSVSSPHDSVIKDFVIQTSARYLTDTNATQQNAFNINDTNALFVSN